MGTAACTRHATRRGPAGIEHGLVVRPATFAWRAIAPGRRVENLRRLHVPPTDPGPGAAQVTRVMDAVVASLLAHDLQLTQPMSIQVRPVADSYGAWHGALSAGGCTRPC